MSNIEKAMSKAKPGNEKIIGTVDLKQCQDNEWNRRYEELNGGRQKYFCSETNDQIPQSGPSGRPPGETVVSHLEHIPGLGDHKEYLLGNGGYYEQLYENSVKK